MGCDEHDYRLLRLRKEEEQGDQESKADQDEEWKSGRQGHLRFVRKANLPHRRNQTGKQEVDS